MQIPLLPSPQCPARRRELLSGVHPQDLPLHKCEKVISKSPIVLGDDVSSSGLTVAGHVFNFGNEYAGIGHYVLFQTYKCLPIIVSPV